MKKYQIFLSEIFHFLVAKFSVYLKRHVFVIVLVCVSALLLLLLRGDVFRGSGISWVYLLIFLYSLKHDSK